ncbi:hypothetical protein ACFPK9_07840 [Rubritalea spongiae]|uniref:Uncharacterized protein n=1 Tax=Rubritalea spongiae TaxID=430797 RepID=A0ABW5E130_9BACT
MAKPKGYTSIEFDVYEALNWDRDTIILALNVIRKKFCEPQDLARHGLSAHIMPRELPQKPGGLYPVIGLVIPTTKYFGHFDTHSITSLFEAWKRTHQISDLLKEASSIGVPNWEQLLTQETYPVDPRTLYA